MSYFKIYQYINRNMSMNQLIEDLCEQRSRTSCYGSNHVAVLLEPKRYCVLPKGAKLWGE